MFLAAPQNEEYLFPSYLRMYVRQKHRPDNYVHEVVKTHHHVGHSPKNNFYVYRLSLEYRYIARQETVISHLLVALEKWS